MTSRRVDWQAATPERHGEVWTRRDGEQIAVYDPDSGRLHVLNASALAIWELCDGETTGEEMAGAIAELTSGGTDSASQDVVAALQALWEQQLISVED